jgi:hypothetical protein
MHGKKTTDPLLHLEGHRKPVTRRDFLSRGLYAGAGLVIAPTLSAIAARPAGAQLACGGPLGGAGKIPFICIDLAGGANIAGGNVLVGDPSGQLGALSDSGYVKLGIPTDMLPTDPVNVDAQMGLAFHADSAMLRGIRLRAVTPATLDQTNGVGVCARSEDDTQNNPHNPMYGIAGAGADGELLTLIGTENTDSGGKSIAPMSMIDPAIRPTKVDRPSDATGLVDTGKLVQMLGQQDAGTVMRAVEAISTEKLGTVDEDQLIEDLVACGYIQSATLVEDFGSPDALDPTNDPVLNQVFSAADINGNSAYAKTATVMKLVLNGFAGAGTIELGGYDYHDGTRATGERRDELAGEVIGGILEYASLINQQVMIYVFSDGSVDSNGENDDSVDGGGKGIWQSDNASTSSVFMLAYNPPILGVRPALTPQIVGNQIGYFRASGSLETAATPVSNSVDLLAEAVVLNYLALHNETANFESALPNFGLPAASRDALTAFEPIR